MTRRRLIRRHGTIRGRSLGRFLLKGLPYPGTPGQGARYRPTLSDHVTITGALALARVSGLAAWHGPEATAAGHGPAGRLGRLWIEEVGKPATLAAPYERWNEAGLPVVTSGGGSE